MTAPWKGSSSSTICTTWSLDLRGQLLERGDSFQSYVLDQVEAAERTAGDRAHLVLACSAGDAVRFAEKYGWPLSRSEMMPNGVFSQRIVPAGAAEKAALKAALGLPEDRSAAFFIGSDYMPNVEAAKIVVEKLAPSCPEMVFVIAGASAASFLRHAEERQACRAGSPSRTRSVG